MLKNKGKVIRVLAMIFAVAFVVMSLAGCTAADTSTADGEDSGGGSSNMIYIVYIVIIVVVFYFFMIRPDKKKRQKAEEMRAGIAPGDTVTTIGGIVGKVAHVSDDFLVIETSEDRVRIQITKWAVSTTGKASDAPEDQAEQK